MKGRRERRCKQILDDFKERRGYCKLKQEALDCIRWRTWFGRGHGNACPSFSDKGTTGSITHTKRIIQYRVDVMLYYLRYVNVNVNVYVMLCYVMLCCAVLCCVMLYYIT